MPVSKITLFKAGAIGNVYRCSINLNTPSGLHVNTFYLRQVSTAPSGDVFADILATWDGVVKADYLALFSNTCSLLSMRISQVDNGLKGLPSATLALSGTGTRVPTGDRQPGQLAAVLQFDTGFSGRKGRGRNFIGNLFEGDQASGLVDAALRTLMEAYGTTMLTTWVSGSALAEWVVFTLVDNTVALVTSSQAKIPVYTQRRRRQGVGA